jgi:diaminohydroxyphosphoribosylaminopyrimidine deaminase/5-amino-6-(5-phosphoribosylamino)uracil reductase
VLADDPQLTCRIPGGRDPLRVIVDGRLRTPASALVFRNDPARVRLYTLRDRGRKALALRRLGATIRRGGGDRPGSLRRVLADLGRAGIMSVLVEGGSRVASRALRDGVVDRVAFFVAPKLLGVEGQPAIGPLGIRRMAEALRLRDLSIGRIGDDLLIQGTPAGRQPPRLP